MGDSAYHRRELEIALDPQHPSHILPPPLPPASVILDVVSVSLPEIARVLKPGGLLWVTLHPFSMLWEQARKSNWKGKGYFGYVLVNSFLFHVWRGQFRCNGRFESFQTRGGMRRALLSFGFEDVRIEMGSIFWLLPEGANS